MAWSFRKRIKIIPGIHLNLSKSGISTSIGVKGMNITLGKGGTYLNTSISGLGISNRQKLSGPESKPQPQIYDQNQPDDLTENIFSADVQEITSQDMRGIKETIILAHQQREELKRDVLKIQATLGFSKIKLALSYLFMYGLIKKTIPKNIKENIEVQKEAIWQTKTQIENSFVKLDVDFEEGIRKEYDKLTVVFNKLTNCQKIWDVTSAHFQDRAVTRSSASTLVKKREVKFMSKSLLDIKSDFDALYFQNANGADLYFYPSFIVMYSNITNFAIIGFDEIKLEHSYVRFTETGTVPTDSKVIDKTWAKVNKNGSPDRRFKGNYQIPVVRYGEIRLLTATGLNEEYEFSNYECSEEFSSIFTNYQKIINQKS